MESKTRPAFNDLFGEMSAVCPGMQKKKKAFCLLSFQFAMLSCLSASLNSVGEKPLLLIKKLAKTWLSCVITRRSFWMDGAKLCLLVSKPSLAALRNLSIKNRSEDKRHQKHRKNPRFCSGWTSVEGPECLEQDSMRDKIRQLLQIYKAHVYWMGKGQ